MIFSKRRFLKDRHRLKMKLKPFFRITGGKRKRPARDNEVPRTSIETRFYVRNFRAATRRDYIRNLGPPIRREGVVFILIESPNPLSMLSLTGCGGLRHR